jgi:6-phospho-beta-glucosidase
MTIEAAMTGSREVALLVMLNDPWSSWLTIEAAGQLLEELLEANKEYLPRFFEKKKAKRGKSLLNRIGSRLRKKRISIQKEKTTCLN